jgi:hypothetical protein
MIRVKLLTITVEAGAVSLLLVFLSSSLSNSLSNSADTVPRLLQSDEFDHHELLLPFPGSDILKLRIPPCAYPAGSANHAEMLRTYQAMMDDLRSWLGRNGDYTPLMADFQAYAHRRNHMDSMTIAEGGNELWGRIYMTFLHYSVGLAWGEVVPGLPPGWCEPWPSCVYATEIPLPGVSSDWCRPWKECASQASHVKSAEVQRNVASIRVPLPSRADSAQECGSTGIVDTASEMLYFPRSPGCPTMTAMVRFNDLPFSRCAASHILGLKWRPNAVCSAEMPSLNLGIYNSKANCEVAQSRCLSLPRGSTTSLRSKIHSKPASFDATHQQSHDHCLLAGTGSRPNLSLQVAAIGTWLRILHGQKEQFRRRQTFLT